MGRRYSGSSWAEADAFINGGRTPSDGRTAGNNRRLSRRANGDIEFILHSTPVVTYHKGDNMQTIYMGGWNSQLTKMDIHAHSNARVGNVYHNVKDAAGNSMKGQLAVHHKDDPISPPRITKCRKCHGKGFLRSVCRGTRYRYRRHQEEVARDAVWAALPGMTFMVPATRWKPRNVDDRAVETETGRTVLDTKRREDRNREVCDHAMFEPHFQYDECWNCDGSGRRDYGSHPVPTPIGSHERVLIHPDGRVWKPIEDWVAMIAGLRRTRRRNAS